MLGLQPFPSPLLTTRIVSYKSLAKSAFPLCLQLCVTIIKEVVKTNEEQMAAQSGCCSKNCQATMYVLNGIKWLKLSQLII